MKRMEILSGTKASKAATLPDAFRTEKHPGDLRISSQSCPRHLPDPEPLCPWKYLCDQSGQYAETFNRD